VLLEEAANGVAASGASKEASGQEEGFAVDLTEKAVELRVAVEPWVEVARATKALVGVGALMAAAPLDTRA